MSTRAKYQTISTPLPPNVKTINAKNSLVGLNVVADYIDPQTGQRKLVFERPDATITKRPATQTTPAKAKTVAPKPKPQPATSFPPPEANIEGGAA